jgi:hypothetical protein
MADRSEANRLQALEERLNALEGQAGGRQAGGRQAGGRQAAGGGEEQPEGQAALIQAFLQGALIGNAAAQSAASGAGEGEAGAAFLSIFGCGSGGGGWSPTNYDSVFWCRSKFLCNPLTLGCLC